MKKLLSLCLAAGMLLGMCACRKDDTGSGTTEPPAAVSETAPAEGNTPGTVSEPTSEPVRQLTAAVPDGGVFVDVASGGGTVYASVQYDGSTGEPVIMDSGAVAYDLGGANAIYAVDMDTGALTQVCARDVGGIWDFVPMADGTVWAWVLIQSYSEDTGDVTTSTLFHLDSANTALAAVDAVALTGSTEDAYELHLAPLDDGTLAVTWGDRDGCAVKALDSAGNVTDIASTDDGCFWDLTRMEDGTVAGVLWTYDTMAQSAAYSLVRLDPASGSITELPLPEGAQLNPGDKNIVQCGDGAKIYLEDYQGAVSVYDAADGSLTSLFNWLDLGVTGGGYGAPVAMFYRDGALWAAAFDEDMTELDVFPVDADGGGREVLTLASFYSDDTQLARAVADFNRTNTQYRIAVKYYSTYDDPLAQFNYDVIAGDVPDILSLYRMPYDTLRHQGMLADLTGYIDADADIDRENYLDWSWKADTASDGGIYSLVTRFAFNGYWAREGDELTRESFTLDKYLELASSGEALEYANGDGPEYRSWIVEDLVAANLDQFANIDTAQCHFDGEEFGRILQVVQDMTIATGDTYHTTRITSSGLESYRWHGYVVGDGYPVPLGRPTAGGGKFALAPQQELAMSSQAAHPDACWQFLRTFLLPEGQQPYTAAFLGGFPVLKSALDELAAQETGGEAQETGGECTQEDVDAVNALFQTGDIYVNRFSSMREAVCDILHEELVPFFSGGVTAETVTADLQSRIGLYLSEHS